MSLIVFNAVIEIKDPGIDGMWRVLTANHNNSGFVYLVFIPEKPANNRNNPNNIASKLRIVRLPAYMLHDLETRDLLKHIELEPEPRLRQITVNILPKYKLRFEARVKVMRRFLNPKEFMDCLERHGNIGLLVAQAVLEHQCSREHVHNLFRRLCWYGFESGSLHDRYDKSGAPGVRRPWGKGKAKNGRRTNRVRVGMDDPFPQTGMTVRMIEKVLVAYSNIDIKKLTFPAIYQRIIEHAFVNKYRQTDDGRKPVMPKEGTYPNKNQIRYVIKTYIPELERLARSTYPGHFNRNMRGLTGHAWEGLAGPGHRYAMDSTTADIYLRSSINPAWIIGRPVIYIIVDVWSTAIVGFHVCLTGPSWETAKVALFAMANPSIAAELWGYKFIPTLFPAPTIPCDLLHDRGEYLSKQAETTAFALGYNANFNPAYRPDLKGLVEVFNRITKDQQYGFIPGAIDARRRELEAKTEIKDAKLNMRQYASYLYKTFSKYNLHTDRTYRMTDEMIARGVGPTPAGLWKFGFDAGVGYRKHIPFSKMVTNLLPSYPAVVRDNGIYLGALKYQFEESMGRNWTALSRNLGVFELDAHVFPGSTAKLFWPDTHSNAVKEFILSPHALASNEVSLDDWVDADEYQKIISKELEHGKLEADIQHSVNMQDIIKDATSAVKQAEADYEGNKVSVTDARKLETSVFDSPLPSEPVKVQPSNTPAEDKAGRIYQEAMARIFNIHPEDGSE